MGLRRVRLSLFVRLLCNPRNVSSVPSHSMQRGVDAAREREEESRRALRTSPFLLERSAQAALRTGAPNPLSAPLKQRVHVGQAAQINVEAESYNKRALHPRAHPLPHISSTLTSPASVENRYVPSHRASLASGSLRIPSSLSAARRASGPLCGDGTSGASACAREGGEEEEEGERATHCELERAEEGDEGPRGHLVRDVRRLQSRSMSAHTRSERRAPSSAARRPQAGLTPRPTRSSLSSSMSRAIGVRAFVANASASALYSAPVCVPGAR